MSIDLLFCSWRHTPFRKTAALVETDVTGSWRHTPFRKFRWSIQVQAVCSWRHTPFRNINAVRTPASGMFMAAYAI